MRSKPVYFMAKACAVFGLCTIFAVAAWAGNYRSLHTFYNYGDPAAVLVFDNAGNAYGTTVAGGDHRCGTIFKLTPSGGNYVYSVLYSFGCFGDGKNPYGGVTLDATGNLYGTTVAGGSGGMCAGDGCGLIFELMKSGSNYVERVLYNFTGANDGFGPGAALIFDTAGNLYGTAPDGGVYGFGVVYQLSPNGGGWTLNVIHQFTGGADGGLGSLGPLLLDKVGNLYGVAEIGGDHSAGIAYRLSRSGSDWKFTTLYAFKGQPDAAFPYGGLIADSAGAFYGTTYYGGTNGLGSVFELHPGATPASWAEQVLYSFQGGTDGSLPTSTLVFDSAKNLYGTTSTGGTISCDCGTVFKLTPQSSMGWSEAILHIFGGSDGSYPSYGLTYDGVANFYGTTAAGGGYHGKGIIFELTP